MTNHYSPFKTFHHLAAALFTFFALTTAAQPAFPLLEFPRTNEIRVRLTNATTFSRIDASTNLLDWSGLLTAPAGSLTYTDIFTSFNKPSARYYRAESVTNSGTFAGDHITTTNGDIIIRPVTHASFVMKWNGKMIYNDPDTQPASTPYTLFPKADLILISHDHGDHWDAGVLNNVINTGGKIIATSIVYNHVNFPPALRPSTTILANGASTNFFDIEILAVPAYNGNHPKGNGNGYVITLGGKKLYMAGDTSDTPEMRALTGIDIAFIPMNSFTFTTGAAAAAAVRAFQPKIVYPYHYSNSPQNPPAFKTAISNDLPIEVRLRNWYP